MQEKE
jgi:hypothetical protein